MTLRDWFPVITLLLGSALTLVGGLLSEHYRNAFVVRRQELERKLVRITFQRDTLLQLQDAGRDLIEITTTLVQEKWPEEDRKLRRINFAGPKPVSLEADRARRRARLEIEKLTPAN
jgi:hypothetical protein